jgi:hypothetical protein
VSNGDLLASVRVLTSQTARIHHETHDENREGANPRRTRKRFGFQLSGLSKNSEEFDSTGESDTKNLDGTGDRRLWGILEGQISARNFKIMLLGIFGKSLSLE